MNIILQSVLCTLVEMTEPLSVETPKAFLKPSQSTELRTFGIFSGIYCGLMKVFFFIMEIAIIIITLEHTIIIINKAKLHGSNRCWFSAVRKQGENGITHPALISMPTWSCHQGFWADTWGIWKSGRQSKGPPVLD